MAIQTGSKTIQIDYLKTIGIVNNGLNGRGFTSPYDLAVHKDGRIFVINRCDPLRSSAVRVGICNLDEDYLSEFGYGNGAGDGQMVWPVALAFDSKNRVFLTDEHILALTTPRARLGVLRSLTRAAQSYGDGVAAVYEKELDHLRAEFVRCRPVLRLDCRGPLLLRLLFALFAHRQRVALLGSLDVNRAGQRIYERQRDNLGDVVIRGGDAVLECVHRFNDDLFARSHRRNRLIIWADNVCALTGLGCNFLHVCTLIYIVVSGAWQAAAGARSV